MVTADDIIRELQTLFPDNLRAEWDTTEGLISGKADKAIKRVALSLEFRDNISNTNTDMIILHHPPIFGPENEVTNPSYKKWKQNGEVIYAIHSRMDKAGFPSIAIAEKLFESSEYDVLKILDDGTVIIVLKRQTELKEAIGRIKSRLRLKCVNIIRKKDAVKRIGIHGGEAFQLHHIADAEKEDIDLYLGGDMSHHLAEQACFFDSSFIDIGHVSEQEGMRKLTVVLEKKFPSVRFEYMEQKPLWSTD